MSNYKLVGSRSVVVSTRVVPENGVFYLRGATVNSVVGLDTVRATMLNISFKPDGLSILGFPDSIPEIAGQESIVIFSLTEILRPIEQNTPLGVQQGTVIAMVDLRRAYTENIAPLKIKTFVPTVWTLPFQTPGKTISDARYYPNIGFEVLDVLGRPHPLLSYCNFDLTLEFNF